MAALSQRKKFGSAELDRILMTLGERACMFFRRCFGAAEGRTGFRAHDAFLEEHEEPIATFC